LGVLLVEHLRENVAMARLELLSALRAEGVQCTWAFLGPFTLLRCQSDPLPAVGRLGMSKRAAEVEYAGPPGNAPDLAKGRAFLVSSSVLPRGDRRRLAARVAEAQSGEPSFSSPELLLKAVLVGEILLLGRVVWERESFAHREPHRRPFRTPVSMKPKYARLLVNLSAVPRGGRLLDPFCGAGSILIEAALMGIEAHGSDRDPRMVEGARENLEALGLKASLEVADVGEVEGEYDGIATDAPYGRSSSTGGEPLRSLMRRAFATFHRVLRPGGRAAVALGDESLLALSDPLVELYRVHQRVHGSLERTYSVLARLG